MPKNKAIVLAMIDRDMTQIEVAKKADIHESRLSRIVNGHDDATEDEQKAIAKALKASVTDLFDSNDHAVA